MNIRHGTSITLFTLLLTCLFVQGMAHARSTKVTEADPAVAEKGTVNLDVTVSGREFDVSSQATFLLTGTNDAGGITVNSTQFENSKELIVNISIDACADAGSFDIEVLSGISGRRGKGNKVLSVPFVGNEDGGSEDGNPCEDADENVVGIAHLSRDVTAELGGAFIEYPGDSGFNTMDGQLTGSDKVTLSGDAAIALLLFDDECRLPWADPELCPTGASGKGVLPLGTQRLPSECGEAEKPACDAVSFDASTGLVWDIRLDHDQQGVERVQFQLTWNNENGEQHFLRVGWVVPDGSLSYGDFGELIESEPDSLRSATIEFLAVPFRLEGDLMVGDTKQTEGFVYSDYGQDGTITIFIETSGP